MIQPNLKAHLEPIARTYRQFQFWRGLAACWGIAALVASIFLLLYAVTGWWSPLAFRSLIIAAALGAGAVWLWSRSLWPSLRWIAQQIERENPKLRTALLAAIEQEPTEPDGSFSYLQERVIIEALSQNRRDPWIQKFAERLFFAQSVQWATLFLLVGLLVGLAAITPRKRVTFVEALGIQISPGDTTVERGSSLVVLARFGRRFPAEATLVIDPAAGQSRRISLAKNLNDPVFGGTIPEVNSDLLYHVEYAGERTRSFKVGVFDFPTLQRADAHLRFPDYTRLPEKTIQDTRRISAVEGTVLDYSFKLNKPVASAKLVAKDKTVVPLLPDKDRTNTYMATMNLTLEQSRQYELQLVDEAGRTNKLRSDVVIDVLTNRVPDLKLASPRQDQRVSPLEELNFQAQASDDFGLQSFGLAYTVAGAETKFVELGKGAPANEKRQFTHLLPFESLSAKPDELVTYYLWADDFGPDGAVRRTSGDMYFAEVRHFEEIFREGQQQSRNESMEMQQMNGGQQSQTEKLAELQKEIINATWKLQRRENRPKPSASYGKDAEAVREGQEKALEQAEALNERAENPKTKPLVENVVKEMKRALTQLTQATKDVSTKPLPTALTAEQAAYQALLKLQAREFEVSRSQRQRSRGGGGGAQRAQRQLDQLELKQSENRYETQRQALSQQSPQQQEQLQVLNRLKELARRQQDVNERIKELQTALQEAKTEDEKEAVKKQLKRLREEQQQMLADVDELRQRMSRPENQAQMSDARKQLDQTRSEVRDAAENLENGSVSQALASGTRAQRELQQLREDFRKQTSSQFAEEMKQLRSDARQLTQKEEEIGKQIESFSQTQRKTLSDSVQRNEVADQLLKQRSGLTNLLDNMRRVTEQAETAEPLLSKQLYDTLRKTNQGKIDTALTNSVEFLRRGFVPQASELELQARNSLDNLRRDVERAAESVLGDETEALRRARSEIDELRRQLENEVAKAEGRPETGSDQAGQEGASAPNRQPGQRGDGQGDSNRDQTQNPGSQQQGERGQQGGERGQLAGGQRGERGQGQGDQQNAENARGNRGGNARQPGDRQSAENQQGNQSGSQAGQGGRSSQARNTAQNGSDQNQNENGQDPSNSNADGQPGSPGQRGGQRRSLTANNSSNRGGARNPNAGQRGGLFDQGGDINSGGGGNYGPLTGNEYTTWSDRLRAVEETVDFPDLRNQVAEIRERARDVRVEFRQHARPPQWDLVKTQILKPLAEVRQRINEELAKRESNDALVPIDRDPVPGRYSELVRRYYENLGKNE